MADTPYTGGLKVIVIGSFGFAVPRKSGPEYIPPGVDMTIFVVPIVKLVGFVAGTVLRSLKSTVELKEKACCSHKEKSSIIVESVNGIMVE